MRILLVDIRQIQGVYKEQASQSSHQPSTDIDNPQKNSRHDLLKRLYSPVGFGKFIGYNSTDFVYRAFSPVVIVGVALLF